MKKHVQIAITTFVVLGLFVLTGCGNRNPYKVVTFEGTATYQGKPLEQRIILTFSPEQGRPSSAITDKDGHFVAVYSDTKKGVQTGKINVTVAPYDEGSSVEMTTKISSSQIKKLNEAYNFNTPGFMIEVEKGTKNFNLDFQ